MDFDQLSNIPSLPRYEKSPLKQRALHVLIAITIGGSDGIRLLARIIRLVFAPVAMKVAPSLSDKRRGERLLYERDAGCAPPEYICKLLQVDHELVH